MVQQLSYWKVLTRRKYLPADGIQTETKLNRVLGLYDLTALGVGSTLGAGVYVLAGQIAKDQAGPSVMLSFAIAALASLLAGVCYAEFGARVPKAGSAYVYSYVCIGEFVAFIIGWNLILEYMVGTASVCRGISLYLDSLINNTLKNTFNEIAPINVDFLGSYFDFLACGLVLVFGVVLAFGVETSSLVNNFCTCLNITILLFVIIAGAIKSDIKNWTIDVSATNGTDIGSGGYFPYGFAGTLKGAATCFFGFVGFDCIATTGEEVRNPRKNIPRSFLLSLLIIFLCYFGISTVLTLMVPYYLQDANAPLPYAFEAAGWPIAKWIVSIGGLIGLFASLLGALFPLPRIMYSMAQDGLLFRFLGKINPRFQVPVRGSILAALLTAFIAGIFDLTQLVNLLSIGTLLAYSIVAVSITILRYMKNIELPTQQKINNSINFVNEDSLLTSSGTKKTFKSIMVQLFNIGRRSTPDNVSTLIVDILITSFCLLSLCIGLLIMEAYDAILEQQLWALVVLGVLMGLAVIALLLICLQPREMNTGIFRVPFVPIVPAISIFINIYLMLQLDTITWIRFGVWMIIGLPIYIACWCMYDIKNPKKRNPERIAFLNVLKNYNVGNIYAKVGNLKANATHVSNGLIKNDHAVKSLDEIHNLSDLDNELIAVKQSNGNLLYMAETKSNNSAATLGANELNQSSYKTMNDEKCVIAMLDDVLQAEDEHVPRIFGRQYSENSEMYPSIFESTIVVTVHSSSSTSSNSNNKLEDGIEEVTENAHTLDRNLDKHTEATIIAEQFISELLNSPELSNRLEEYRYKLNPIKKNVIEQPKSTLHRIASETSLASSVAIENPMHSERFKNKLSQLIMQAQPVAATKTLNKRHSLQHSKSEPVWLHLLPSTEVTPAVTNEKALIRQNNDIPLPPKFNSELHKTITLKKLQFPINRAQNTVEPLEEKQPEEPIIPFKVRLEAILKRGPSHRLQQLPDIQVRRPQPLHLPEDQKIKEESASLFENELSATKSSRF